MQSREKTGVAPSVGRYMNEIARFKNLPKQDEIELVLRAQSGDEAARRQVIEANLGLVVKIARSYLNHGLALEDMVSEGNLGLAKAIDNYDPKFQVKFATYAGPCIRQRVREALGNQARTIRVPLYALTKIRKLSQASTELSGQLGRHPTDVELGERVELSGSQLENLRTASMAIVSLDVCATDDGEGAPLVECLEDEKTPAPNQVVEKNDLYEILRGALSGLNDRERKIIVERYGLESDAPSSMAAIGRNLSISSERIRQIHATALRKVKVAFSNRCKLGSPPQNFKSPKPNGKASLGFIPAAPPHRESKSLVFPRPSVGLTA